MKARGSVTLHHSNDTNNIEYYSKTQIWQSQEDQSSYFVLMIQIPEKYKVSFILSKVNSIQVRLTVTVHYNTYPASQTQRLRWPGTTSYQKTTNKQKQKQEL